MRSKWPFDGLLAETPRWIAVTCVIATHVLVQSRWYVSRQYVPVQRRTKLHNLTFHLSVFSKSGLFYKNLKNYTKYIKVTRLKMLVTYLCSYVYTGCPGRNMPDFGRLFLTLKYTDITQNTYVYPKLNGYGDNGERSLKVWQLLHTYWLQNTY